MHVLLCAPPFKLNTGLPPCSARITRTSLISQCWVHGYGLSSVAFKVSSLWINPGECNGILPEIFDNLQPFKTLAAHPLEKIDTQ